MKKAIIILSCCYGFYFLFMLGLYFRIKDGFIYDMLWNTNDYMFSFNAIPFPEFILFVLSSFFLSIFSFSLAKKHSHTSIISFYHPKQIVVVLFSGLFLFMSGHFTTSWYTCPMVQESFFIFPIRTVLANNSNINDYKEEETFFCDCYYYVSEKDSSRHCVFSGFGSLRLKHQNR